MGNPAPLEALDSTAARPRPAKSAGAVVIGASYRALGIVRSLGRRGIPVWVLTQDGEVLAAISRYVRQSLGWPTGDDNQQVAFLLELAEKRGLEGWVVFPTDDESTALIARHSERLGRRFQLTTPPWETLRWACDKRLMHQLARDLGIDQPWTRCPRTREELVGLDCPFPLVIKPAMKEGFNRLTAAKAWRVEDRRSLLARYDEACGLVAPDMLMIQEVVPGGGETQLSYAALCQEGRPLAWVVARRVRQFPMDFGRSSTFVETIDDEAGVAEPALRLLSALRFTGMVEVEFKQDARTDRPKLLDINPRVWGWQTLCGRAGVDFIHLQWLLVHGEPVPERCGRAGVRWVRMSTDVPTALLEILRGRLSLGGYARSLRGPVETGVFAGDDPLPGVLELPLLAYLVGKRLVRGKGV